jgi:hypothetical protein
MKVKLNRAKDWRAGALAATYGMKAKLNRAKDWRAGALAATHDGKWKSIEQKTGALVRSQPHMG